MSRRTPSETAPNSAQDERHERQAEALRENLKRRKAQQRARAKDVEETKDSKDC